MELLKISLVLTKLFQGKPNLIINLHFFFFAKKKYPENGNHHIFVSFPNKSWIYFGSFLIKVLMIGNLLLLFKKRYF